MFYFLADGEKYLVGMVVMAVLLVISLAIIAYFVCQNRRLKLLKENQENKSNEGYSEDDHEIPVEDEGNYEDVESEQSTYTALKKPGERDDDDHVYSNLNEVEKDYVNLEESRK